MKHSVVSAILAVALSVLAAPLAADAQQPGKAYRIGRLSPTSRSADVPIFEGFRQGLRDLSWIEGQNIAIEYRFAEGKFDRPPELAAELVRLKVDVIVAGSTPGILAAKNATSTIPIVMKWRSGSTTETTNSCSATRCSDCSGLKRFHIVG